MILRSEREGGIGTEVAVSALGSRREAAHVPVPVYKGGRAALSRLCWSPGKQGFIKEVGVGLPAGTSASMHLAVLCKQNKPQRSSPMSHPQPPYAIHHPPIHPSTHPPIHPAPLPRGTQGHAGLGPDDQWNPVCPPTPRPPNRPSPPARARHHTDTAVPPARSRWAACQQPG